MFFSPLDQFLVIKFSFMNNMWLYISAITIILISVLTLYSILNLVMQDYGEFLWLNFVNTIYSFILRSGGLNNLLFFPVFTLCVSLLSFNLAGLTPLGFTVTTHIFISLSFSILFFFWFNLIFFFRFFLEWGSLFLPTGTPLAILFLIVPIEALSYFSRILSLSIRLFANMLSGHTLLVILSVFLISGISGNFLIVLPLILLHMIFGLEIGVAILQAYVFTTLILLYITDTENFSAH